MCKAKKDDLVKVPVGISGYYAARSVDSMKLSNLATEVNPGLAMLGSDRFTELYLKTDSDNIYRVIKKEGRWVLQNSRGGKKHDYCFKEAELHYSEVSLDKPFYYGDGGRTTKIKEIVAVSATRVYIKLNVAVSNIVSQFKENFRG